MIRYTLHDLEFEFGVPFDCDCDIIGVADEDNDDNFEGLGIRFLTAGNAPDNDIDPTLISSDSLETRPLQSCSLSDPLLWLTVGAFKILLLLFLYFILFFNENWTYWINY